MVLPDSHRIPRVPWYLGNELEASSAFAYGAITLYCPYFQMVRLADWFVTSWHLRRSAASVPATPPEKRPRAITLRRFGLFPVRSPLLGESRLLSLPTGTEMFQFPALASYPYGFRAGSPGISREGLPHSGIPGLASVCDYPGLIAAYHALHRLLVPRHPPYTLSSLTPLCFGETEWVPDRYSLVKERIPPRRNNAFSRNIRMTNWWR